MNEGIEVRAMTGEGSPGGGFYGVQAGEDGGDNGSGEKWGTWEEFGS